MSGWLNLNESLNSIKGQISNFANNVLADDQEGTESRATNYEELKRLYEEKELEIENLKKNHEKLQNYLGVINSQNGKGNDNTWEWTTHELMVEEKPPEENISDLKILIRKLENENHDLVSQLEQLDSEHQQNLRELVGIKEHLQQENCELKEKCQQLKQHDKVIAAREGTLKQELQKRTEENRELSLKLEEAIKEQNTLKITHENLKKTSDANTASESFNEQYETILKDNQDLNIKLEDATKELSVLRSTHETLEKTLNDTRINGEQQLSNLTEKLKKYEMENQIISNELQKAKEHVKSSLQKSQEDAENCQKLAYILDSYEKQVSSLKEELDNVNNKINKDKTNCENIEILEKSTKDLEQRLNQVMEERNSLENIISKSKIDYERTISELKLESAELRTLLEKTTKESQVHLENTEKLMEKIKEISLDKEKVLKTYINMITDHVKRFMDSALDPNVYDELSEDPHDFDKQVENICKILLRLKQKCEVWEKEVLQISQEKTKLLNEKNSEIEKLIQNSEILSQDVINKNETIKELETEITNLITNNDVLMSELDSYKNPGLQTISESNEDNVVLLETDLDNANKKIKELEKIIYSGDNIGMPSDSSIILPETGVSDKLEYYQELLNNFDDLKIDYESLKNELSKECNSLKLTQIEKEDLRMQLDKLRLDFENTDYLLSEANFTADGLREELEILKVKLEATLQENKELKLQNMNYIDMKSEFNEMREKWLTEENLRRELESETRGLKEKLQNSKMAETSLKLLHDTLNKEYITTLETKKTLEKSVYSVKENLAEYENKYSEQLQKYDNILLRCEELNTKMHHKDSEILKLQNNLKLIDDQKQELEKMLNESKIQLEQNVLREAATGVSQLQLQERGTEITSLNNVINNPEIKKIELEKLSESQSQENKIQFRLTEEADENENIHNLDNNINDFAHTSTEENTKTSLLGPIVPVNNQQIEQLQQEKLQLQKQINVLYTELKENQENKAVLQQQLQELVNSRNDLINMVTSKHQESLSYHNEIQRLSEILKSEAEKYLLLEAQLVQASSANQEVAKKSEEIDRLVDENNFLKNKCDILAKNLLEEQIKLQQAVTDKNNPSEKELSLSKQLDRLQSHLVELEEHYTQELLQAEQKNSELQDKITQLEQREKNSSNMYTSVNIRANQQVEALQKQLQLVTSQRDELRKNISDAEDANNKQAAALTNLQFVLEQFQKEKAKDVLKETERIRRQINTEKQVQETLRKEIGNLEEQLQESKMGLQAASRLSDQLEIVKKQNAALREEVAQLQQKLDKSQETMQNLTSQTDGKIDKTLIKSLIVGLLSSGNSHIWNKDQTQIVKIIATVLDFSQQDHEKVKVNQPQQASWLGSILSPQPSNQNMSQESLSQAFVRFLENESKPRVVPSLLSDQSSRPSTSIESSIQNTPRASPIILNEIVLPTFADFGQNRNSSSILKDVLKDNINS